MDWWLHAALVIYLHALDFLKALIYEVFADAEQALVGQPCLPQNQVLLILHQVEIFDVMIRYGRGETELNAANLYSIFKVGLYAPDESGIWDLLLLLKNDLLPQPILHFMQVGAQIAAREHLVQVSEAGNGEKRLALTAVVAYFSLLIDDVVDELIGVLGRHMYFFESHSHDIDPTDVEFGGNLLIAVQ